MDKLGQILRQMAPIEGKLIAVKVAYPDGGDSDFIEDLSEVFDGDFPMMLMDGATITLKMVEGDDAEDEYRQQQELLEY